MHCVNHSHQMKQQVKFTREGSSTAETSVVSNAVRSQWCTTFHCPSAAAQLLWHHQGVIAVDLQQVEQKEPVSMGIQAHRPHAFLGKRGIGTCCHLAERLENPVVLLQEEAEDSLKLTDKSQSVTSQLNSLTFSISSGWTHRWGCQVRERNSFQFWLDWLCCGNVKSHRKVNCFYFY